MRLAAFGPVQAEAFAVAAKFLADGLPCWVRVVAQEFEDRGPGTEVVRAVAVLPVLDGSLVHADDNRNLPWEELQVQPKLAQAPAYGMGLVGITVRFLF